MEPEDPEGLYFRDYERALANWDPAVIVDVGTKFDRALYKPDHGPDFHTAMCTDMFDAEPRKVNEIFSIFGQVIEETRCWRLLGIRGSQ
jgi:hypothetical protein